MAGDGFMLNFVSVMQSLATKVKLDKVDPMYLHNPKARIDVKEDTRIKMTEKEAEEWVQRTGKD